ncbi:hypothetical protein [Alkalicoccus chagannorensis]|uniref:hypothetical protein n=1 Tax=Alkalicoccus chagannorensis TaxID=427072 RepID=UPI0004149B64|nr:hypothetical protein [Alkalicoccus chagannorensis]
MNQRFLKLTIFLSSYSPIFYIAAVRLHEDMPISTAFLYTLLAGITVMTVVSFIHAYHGLFMHKNNRQNRPEAYVHARSAQPLKNSLFTAYLVAFFLPIMNTEFNSPSDTMTFLLIFVLLFVLSMQTTMYYFNPLLLIIFGYQVFEAELHEIEGSPNMTPKKSVIITKEHLEFFNDDPDMHLVQIKDGLYFHIDTFAESKEGGPVSADHELQGSEQ